MIRGRCCFGNEVRLRPAWALSPGSAVLPMVCLLFCGLGSSPGRCDNWHGSVRSKVQVDNRYTLQNAHVFGELWGQGFYDNTREDLHGAVEFVTRTGYQPDGGGVAGLYQAFVEKGFDSLNTRVKLGRFQRTDNLGLYLVDGGAVAYASDDNGWGFDAYAGHPSRYDHVISVEGKFVGGLEGRAQWTPDWGWGSDGPSLSRIDVRGGYQYFWRDLSQSAFDYSPYTGSGGYASGNVNSGALIGDTGLLGAGAGSYSAYGGSKPWGSSLQRLYFATTGAGRLGLWRNSDYELGVLGTYRADREAFENIRLNGQLDLTNDVRVRSSYEYFQPRDPILTFREKFYSAYALGEQTLARTRIQHEPVKDFNYYVGGLASSRQGYDGYGGELGANYVFNPNFGLIGEFDYMSLGPETASSFYLSSTHTVNSRLQMRVNTALRFEDKILYGFNRAVGAEIEAFYMLRNNLVLNVAGSYVWYTRILDEYLGAVQVIYYFDNFKPKGM